MAWTFTTNQTPATGAVAVYNLKERMKAAGWVVKASSDGLTYGPAADQIGHGGSGAGGMANTGAWFRIQAPDGIREFTFHRGTTNQYWRVKYSASAKFTGGTPGATQTPTATDEVVMRGSGTDASAGSTSWFGTDGTYRQQIGADNAAPYAFWMSTYATGGSVNTSGSMVFDPVSSSSPADTDPVVIYFDAGASPDNSIQSNGSSPWSATSSGPGGWLKKGLAGETYVGIAGLNYNVGNTSIVPGGGVTNPHDGDDDELPIVYYRGAAQTAPQGYKGISGVFRWHVPTRACGDVASVAAAMDRFILPGGKVSVPWDGVTVPTV